MLYRVWLLLLNRVFFFSCDRRPADLVVRTNSIESLGSASPIMSTQKNGRIEEKKPSKQLRTLTPSTRLSNLDLSHNEVLNVEKNKSRRITLDCFETPAFN